MVKDNKAKDDKKTLAEAAAEKIEQSKKKIEDLIQGTEAGRIWNDIKDREIFMFALPDQRVSHHASPVLIDTEKLYLVLQSSAALPSLEEAVGKSDPRRGIVAYAVTLEDRFAVVTPVPVPLSAKLKK